VKFALLLVLALVLTACQPVYEFQYAAIKYTVITVRVGIEGHGVFVAALLTRDTPQYNQSEVDDIALSLDHGLQIFHDERIGPPFPPWGNMPTPHW